MIIMKGNTKQVLPFLLRILSFSILNKFINCITPKILLMFIQNP